MAINIWLASWNCENKAPDNTMLDDFMVNDVTTAINNNPNTEPDLIIIGLQEAKKDDNEKFVSDRLAKAEKLENYYEQIASAYLEGRTEGKNNYLQIGVLCRKNQNNPPITDRETGNYEDTEPSDPYWLDGLKRLGRVNEKGKGGAFVKFTYSDAKNPNGLRLGFINAHLDSKKPDKTKRESQIRKLLCTITGLNEKAEVQQIKEALANDFDAVFFMGDLNYRLKTFPNLQNDPVFSTVHNIDTIKKDDNFQRLKQLGSDTKVSELTEWILNPNLRRYLANLDSLYTSALVDQINGYGFCFPPASHLLPTYKRYYKGKTDTNPCRLLADNVTKENIRGCYFNGREDSGSIPYSTGRKAFELGWLDRIGYKARVKVQPLPGQTLQLESKNGIVLSDHTPVLLKVQVGDT